MSRAETFLRDRRDTIVEELKRFVEIPSVSTDPVYAGHVHSAAIFVADRLKAAGLTDTTVHPTAGHPVVTASWRRAPNQPTILIYGHYDVQPPDPIEAWRTEPFKPIVCEGCLYGRGASDDKGPMLIPIKVVEAYLATDGKLPINVVFLCEGEEEVSSAHLEAFVRANRPLLAADFALSADGAQWRADRPSVIVGCRGICSLDVTVAGPAKDLHSGRHGGSVANPIQALVRLLSSLHDAKSRVSVHGFYDRVVDLSAQDTAAIAAMPFDERAYLHSIGARVGAGEDGYSLLQRNWARPTLELNGIHGGYTGPGTKTVIPARASAKISCRLVPDQDPEDITTLIAAHLRAYAPNGTDVDVRIGKAGARPYAIPSNHRGLALAELVLAEVTGIRPMRVRMGASLPVSEIFKRVLDIDTVFFSFATSDEDYHAPNEFFRLSSLANGLVAWTRYFGRLGER